MKEPKTRTLFGERLLTGREIPLHLIVSIALMAAPYPFIVYFIPWLSDHYVQYRGLHSPDFARWVQQRYWIVLLAYLISAFIVRPQPDIEAIEFPRRSHWNALLLTIGVILIPGKWFLLALYSIFFRGDPDQTAD
ncbi:hypothetical protein LLG95_08665 [bacterium]|nr:hypothetical protein [bacterium]